ncbi:pentapeptide repeat-containing protein [Bradyrhizobium erythrophlei]|uniref:pentapeptide repeat-containing protein n=1 Tax=Bradyrhizobium erythrophlei TaxID=1437360 RepID=UPI0035E54BC5
MFAWSGVGKRMPFGRRDVFTRLVGAVATATASICTPNTARGHSRRVSQADLNDAIERHAMWLVDGVRGARAIFSHCDLSGLDFGFERETPVDLREADFTGADLTGIKGNEVSFVRAAIRGATLSWSHLKRPVFSYASLRDTRCNDVVWGWDDCLDKKSSPLATCIGRVISCGCAIFRRRRADSLNLCRCRSSTWRRRFI